MGAYRFKQILGAILLSSATAGAVPAAPILLLVPSGALTGTTGTTDGWGFTIANDANYIEITGASFCLNPGQFPICDLPATGTFRDFISFFNHILLGPPGGADPSSAQQAFDRNSRRGVGSFTFERPGKETGEIVLTYNMFDLNPNDPRSSLLATDLILRASAGVEGTGAPVPEPATAALMGAAWAVLAGRVRRSHSSRGAATPRPNGILQE
jgi:hypothetical protein